VLLKKQLPSVITARTTTVTHANRNCFFCRLRYNQKFNHNKID